MIILLKIILGLLSIATGFTVWNVWKDYRSTKKQDGYDELSIWRRARFNMQSFFILSSLISLIVFLAYFIVIKITMG